MQRILYIEDDQDIGSWVKRDLEERGYQVTWHLSGDGAEKAVNASDIVILDVMLPGLDGFSVGRRLKTEEPDIPVLILSARTSVDDKLQGLDFADDYLTKPFHPEELAARIEVLLRRFQKQEPENYELGHLLIYPTHNRIESRETGEEIILTGKQYHIFQFLLRHPNQILTKEQIFEGVWGESFIEGDKTLMVHIRYLREKLEKDPTHPKIIETIRGLGYRVKT
ncbi:response regulator transcription factor [Tuberibacillus sp. Marseille-P3662]|uniref:response regulator transcription factor n=1 Tax=Tuberibacillus sp. Marseille-P3662 TaxID=1965358 RepID=UPI000A1CCF95|nr:response regulator transcription factor [Tuberibacillus sp. Marseille-P3662]